MVVTRAQGVSVSHGGGHPREMGPPEDGPPASQLPALQASPPVPPPLTQDDRVTALAVQVQSLVSVVHQLQQQQLAAALPPSVQPLVSAGVDRLTQESDRGRSPRRRVSHPRASVHRRREASGRSRSSSRRSSSSHRRRPRRELERAHRHRRGPSVSSGSSREGSYDGRVARRAERRLEEYHQRLDELSRRMTNQPEIDYDSRPPLSRRITDEPISSRFRVPQLEPYDGTSDPLDHLESYKVLMQVQGATDALLCIAFPATLRKAARAWYSRLPPRSISSFRQLERAFLTHFDACRRIPRVADSLFAVQQKGGESLRDYVARFKEAALEVYNLDDPVAMLALKRGLRPSRFAYSLDKKPPGSYAELLGRAQKYIRADEADSSRRDADGGPRKKPSPPEADKPRPRRAEPARRPEPPRRPDNRQRTLAPREGPFTPLLAPITHILMEIEGEPFLQRPVPLKPGATRNKNVYCRFHRDHGHDTEECRQLKKAIEDLIQRGYLGKFVRRGNPAAPGPSAPQPAPAGVDNAPTEKMIAMITRGAEGTAKRPRGARGVESVFPFFEKDLEGVDNPNNDSVVVSMTIAKHPVRRILVDSGSSVDVLGYDAFVRMNLSPGSLRPVTTPLMGFTGDSVRVEGEITLPVTAGTPPLQSTVGIKFLVVRVPLAYNAILGRPGLNLLDAVISTKRLLVRFPTNGGVGEMRGERNQALSCYHAASGPQARLAPTESESLDPREAEKRGEPAEQLLTFPLGDDPERTVRIGGLLRDEARDSLLAFLRANSDVFAWSAADMPGVPPEVITHQLNANPQCRPVRQKKRSFAPERQRAIDEEVGKLIAAGHIREARYPDWLANVVMVRKANGGWRMCVDFTDLNKACPKDSFPLPRIDQLVDATSGHETLSFMDAFSGYNQIRMHPADEEATSFVTEKGVYCYRVMPFGLKNAGATYQRLMNRIFERQIGRNMEVYVDDMLTKSVHAEDHVKDLAETFDSLRRYHMKLNPRKCAFGVAAGKFLGFLVTQRGIEANPDKIRAILDMRPPTNKKEVQRLTGRVAALSRFLSRSAERCLPFFKALRKVNGFEWTKKCQEAFEELKEFLSTPPLLSKPTDGEDLFLYLVASDEAVSSVLVRLEPDGAQRPIYYTSKVLHDAEVRYTKTEKIIFALIVSAQRLRPYFQAHPIVVLTDQPLRTILSRPDTSGRLAKWALKLAEFDLAFWPRSALKSQVLADFLVECVWTEGRSDDSGESSLPPPEAVEEWILHVDGASNSHGSGAGLLLAGPNGAVIEYALRFLFPATNNQAEYEALLAGMRLARELRAGYLRAFTDSQLVSGQITGEYEARDAIMARYLSKVREQAQYFSHFSISYIPRGENARADALSRLATSSDGTLGRTYVEHLEVPSIEVVEALPVDSGPEWTEAYIQYLTNGVLPDNRDEARLLKRQAPRFLVLDGRLYRRSFSHPLLKCVGPADADYILREIHEGICGSHLGGRALAHKALRQGYYWPTMRGDAAELVRRCDSCQRHASVQRQPTSELHPLSAPWPFAQWGMDILGPFPPASCQRRFLLVAIDHFTKWVEAEALAKITESKVRSFFWRSVVCRFGIPHTLVTDNGRQFDNAHFREFCTDLGIRQRFTSVAHPQTNGATEVMNRTILQGLRTRLGDLKGRWVDELPSVLWAYHTTPRVPMGETPFCLMFGSEAVIPVEIGLPNSRIESFSEEDNPDQLRSSLDLVEEVRDRARLKMAAYRQRAAKYYNRRVRSKAFIPGDLVLRRAEVSRPTEGGKLSPRWEGPYRVTEVLHRGAYRIEGLDGVQLPRTWNSDNLRRYYQ